MGHHREKRIEQIMVDYVGAATHTATELENNNRAFFERYFASVDYLRQHPQLCGFYPIAGDALGRCVPWALRKGQGAQTVVLIHHSDTVDTDDYGALKQWAYSPYELTQRYHNGEADLDAASADDLRSGEWLFGRGVADMKGGAAIHMALFEEYAGEADFSGNVLLLGLPDEENLSAGMRSAVHLLGELKEKHGLQYSLMLNIESQERDEPNDMRVYDGSVGKLMPICYVRGKLAHVGQVFSGLNPIHILSEIVMATELCPDFIEQVGNTEVPPPAWLYLKDRKEVYDVSLPLAAAGYMSVLTLKSSAREVMARVHDLAAGAFERVIARANRGYRVYMQDEQATLPWKVNVQTYDQVYQQALRDAGDALPEALADYQAAAKEQIARGTLSMAEAAFQMIERTVAHLKSAEPLVVLAMSPPYYPHVHNSMLPGGAPQITGLLEYLAQYTGEKLNSSFHVKSFYTGISDLSYALYERNLENADYIRANMLLWGEIYDIPLDEIRDLSIPVLNIGPWGKDLHKYTERVHMKDLLERVPALVDAAIRHLLQ